MLTATLALAALAPASRFAAAQGNADGTSLERIEKQAEEQRETARELEGEARRLSQEVRAIKAESVAVARRAQDLESELTRIEDTLATLEQERAEKAARLAARRDQLEVTLSALQRIAVLPPEALAVAPSSPLEIVRSASLLRVAVPEIEARAARLRDDLRELHTLRAEIEQQQASLRETATRLSEERQNLRALLERKQTLRQRTTARSREAAEQAEELARQAEDMRDLLAKLKAQAEARAEGRRQRQAERMPLPATKPPPPGAERSVASLEQGGGDERARAGTAKTSESPAARQTARLSRPSDIRDFPGERASLTMPARGRVVTRFGARVQRAGGATRSKGIEIATRAGAQVVAPYDGQVAYAGPFRGYGRILIIEHGGRYHSLLAGLERIDAVVGQWVLAGEPVGVMGNGSHRDPELYLELRRTGQPVNPLPWLAQTGDKVRG